MKKTVFMRNSDLSVKSYFEKSTGKTAVESFGSGYAYMEYPTEEYILWLEQFRGNAGIN